MVGRKPSPKKAVKKESKGFSLGELDQQSWISLGLGAIVVVVVGLLVFNYFTQLKNPPIKEEIAFQETVPSEEAETKPNFEYQPSELPTSHVVESKEHLWGLAKRYYDNGYLWVEIAKANSLKNPDLIEMGLELKIPKVESLALAEKTTPESEVFETKIPGKTYTVKEGDNLCKIGRQAYGDCVKGWTIAETNHLENPHLIFPGQELVIPRED